MPKNKKIKYIPTQNPDPLEKVHYVCSGGCGFVSNTPGKCYTPGCYRFRNPLTECQCKDGMHQDVITRNVGSDRPLPPNTTLKAVSKLPKKKSATKNKK